MNNTLEKEGWGLLTACPSCESNSLLPFLEAKDRHYGIQGVFPIMQCGECSLVFLNPMPDEPTLTALYPDDYYAYQEYHSKNDQLKLLIKRLCLVSIHTKDPSFLSPGRALDIGCGSGKFLAEKKVEGWEAFGVEVSSNGARVGIENGINIFNGTLDQAAFEENYFDYIRLNHSFEHITRPNETLQEIHRILKPEGKLMIGVPNIDSANHRLFKKYWWYMGAPVHPFTYSVKTLSQILEKNNLFVEKVVFNSDFSGVLGSLQIFMNRNSGRISTEGALIHNFPLVAIAHRIAKINDLFKKGDAIELTARKA